MKTNLGKSSTARNRYNVNIKIGNRFTELDKCIYFESKGNIYRES